MLSLRWHSYFKTKMIYEMVEGQMSVTQLYLSMIWFSQAGFFLLLYWIRVKGREVSNPEHGLKYLADLEGEILGTCRQWHQWEDYRWRLQTPCSMCVRQLWLLTSEHISYISWPFTSKRGSSDQFCLTEYEQKGWTVPGLAPKMNHKVGHSLQLTLQKSWRRC